MHKSCFPFAVDQCGVGIKIWCTDVSRKHELQSALDILKSKFIPNN